MPISDSRVRLVIGSQLENIDLVQIVLSESLQKLEVDADTSQSIGLAVGEAVANAIEHGNRQDPGKQVAIDFGVEGDDVVIRVSDEGMGFDPGDVPDPRLPENLMRPDGRGILVMNSFMDEIDYRTRARGGFEVTLRKSLAPAVERTLGQDKER